MIDLRFLLMMSAWVAALYAVLLLLPPALRSFRRTVDAWDEWRGRR